MLWIGTPSEYIFISVFLKFEITSNTKKPICPWWARAWWRQFRLAPEFHSVAIIECWIFTAWVRKSLEKISRGIHYSADDRSPHHHPSFSSGREISPASVYLLISLLTSTQVRIITVRSCCSFAPQAFNVSDSELAFLKSMHWVSQPFMWQPDTTGKALNWEVPLLPISVAM